MLVLIHKIFEVKDFKHKMQTIALNQKSRKNDKTYIGFYPCSEKELKPFLYIICVIWYIKVKFWYICGTLCCTKNI